jgi:aspartate 1-decarboxylase
MLREMLKSKIHRAAVTQSNLTAAGPRPWGDRLVVQG